MHELARAGERVVPEPRPVQVGEVVRTGLGLQGEELLLPYFGLTMTVSTGFYVRVLIDQLGRELGSVAHMTALRRTASGPFSLEDCAAAGDVADLTLDRIEVRSLLRRGPCAARVGSPPSAGGAREGRRGRGRLSCTRGGYARVHLGRYILANSPSAASSLSAPAVSTVCLAFIAACITAWCAVSA